MNTIRNILIYCLAIVSALSCIKDGKVGDMSSYAITFAPETPQTKAFIDGSFPTGSKMVVFDYMTKLDGTDGWYYIDQASIEGSGSGNVWDYSENSEYLWIYDTSHNFFGWLTSDGTSVSDDDPPVVVSWDDINGILSVHKKKFEVNTVQYDFLYSDVVKRDFTRERPDNGTVDLTMNHLFSAFKFKVQNKRSSVDVRINSIVLNGIYTTKSATIDFDGNDVSPFPDTPVVQYADKAKENITKTLNTTLAKSTGVIENVFSTGENYFMVWAQTADELKDATIDITYTIGSTTTTSTIALNSLGHDSWEGGKRYAHTLTFTEKELLLTCTVKDWEQETDEMDFTDVVVVDQDNALEWTPNTYYSINDSTGEVVIDNSGEVWAEAKFTILSPKGAVWNASLIQSEGLIAAFEFSSDPEYDATGEVGVEGKIRLRATRTELPSPTHTATLRITVQTADGRTIVVKELIPGKPYNEYKIVRNRN